MRRTTLLFAALTLALGAVYAVAVPATPAAAGADKIDKLIAQLASGNFRQREAATHDLEAIGEPALDALKKAAKSGDMEVASRAAALVERIGAKLENARRLAPTWVELKLNEANVDAAVAELSKQSGFNIVIAGDRTKLADRRVTLETGRVPFWVALGRLCEKAELRESDAPVPVNAPPAVQPPVRILPAQPAPNIRIQIQPIQRALPAKEKEGPKPADEKKSEEPAKGDAPVPKAEAKPAPAQPVQPAQPVPAMRVLRPAVLEPVDRTPLNPASATIVLIDGRAEPVPTHVEGAVRVRRAEPVNVGGTPPKPDELPLFLRLQAEPRLTVERVIGVKVEKALDDQGQNLDPVLADVAAAPAAPDEIVMRRQLMIESSSGIARPVPSAGAGLTTLRLKKGEKAARALRELSGTVTMMLRTVEEELAVIEKPSDAKGEARSVRGKGECQLRMLSINKTDDGDYEVSVELQYASEIRPSVTRLTAVARPIGANAPAALPSPVVSSPYGLTLMGADGQPFRLVKQANSRVSLRSNVRTVTLTLTLRPADAVQGEPTKLVFRGTRPISVEVPFTLRDVPLN